jgi:hypothetical protein
VQEPMERSSRHRFIADGQKPSIEGEYARIVGPFSLKEESLFNELSKSGIEFNIRKRVRPLRRQYPIQVRNAR